MNKKTTISKQIIEKLDPCSHRFNNYVKSYGNRKFTVKQFMGLKKITFDDKKWVAFRLMPRNKLGMAVVAMAKSVLSIYEKRFPGDKRVRECIEATSLYLKGKITRKQLIKKRDLAYAAAYAAADAAYYAAAAAYAAAAYAAAYVAADDAAYAAYAAADAYVGAGQKKVITSIILKYWK